MLDLTVFHRVSTDDFRVMLRHLLLTGQIEQTETDGLIVGLWASAWPTHTSSTPSSRKTSSTPCAATQPSSAPSWPLPAGEKIAIAGATWLVEDVDHKRHVVYATKVRGKVPAYFGECPGDIHTHVLERMLKVLEERSTYPYLMKNAVGRLALARRAAAAAQIDIHPLINLGGNTWALFPWLGSYAFLALERLLKIKCAKQLGMKGIDSSRPYYLTFVMSAGPKEFFDVVTTEAASKSDPMELLYKDELPCSRSTTNTFHTSSFVRDLPTARSTSRA